MQWSVWHRDVECGDCGNILTVFEKDVKKYSTKAGYELESHTFYYVVCACGFENALENLPQKIRDAAQKTALR